MNELDDATIAMVEILYDIARTMPADEGRAKWAFFDALIEYQLFVAAEVQRRMQEPSDN